MPGRRRSPTALPARCFAAALGLIALGACSPSRPPADPVPVTASNAAREPPQRAFYAWQVDFPASAETIAALRRNHVQRLYLRFFDIDSDDDDRPVPIAPVELATPLPQGFDYVPVVFLREHVLRHPGPGGTDALAQHLWREVLSIARRAALPFNELQLDCDWTEGTREAYFALLRAVAGKAHAAQVQLSSTIRLHQVKYRERMGVPPVDRGMLMFYNMGRIADGTRSIFDPEAARRYLGRITDYPLPLDAALPIWGWTVVLRDDEPHTLLQATDPAELRRLQSVTLQRDGRYRVVAPTFVQGEMLREGDILQPEMVMPQQALEAAQMLAPVLAPAAAPAKRTVALFHLSDAVLARHDDASLGALYETVR